jgi:DNA topoisomerase-6 subunit B
VEVALAYARPGENDALGAEDPVRVMRFANRVPLLYMAGACAIHRAVTGVNWKSYGLSQPRGALPVGPVVILAHMASVWVPFTSESKEAIAHYPEIVKEMKLALQGCGRKMKRHISRRRKEAEAERKRSYIEKYIPHIGIGLREVLGLSERQETQVVNQLTEMLQKSRK